MSTMKFPYSPVFRIKKGSYYCKSAHIKEGPAFETKLLLSRRCYQIPWFVLIILLYTCSTTSDSSVVLSDLKREIKPAKHISESFLYTHLSVLAHDTLEGRGTGQPGSRKAADYIHSFYTSDTFSSIDDLVLRRQPIAMEGIFWDAISYDVYYPDKEDTVFVSQSLMEKISPAFFYPLLGGSEKHEAPVIFAGYGPAEGEYRRVDTRESEMEDSWVMVFKPNNNGAKRQDDEKGTADWRKELIQNICGHYGAAGVIFINEKEPDQWKRRSAEMSRQLERPLAIRKKGGGYRGAQPSPGLAVSIHPKLAKKILNLTGRKQLDSLRAYWKEPDSIGEPVVTGYHFRNRPILNERSFEEENIVAVITGADKIRKNEVVVMTAHYDHLGLGEPDDNNDIIYNGADDNASGTVVLMQIAEAFAKAASQGYRPSRTLVFLHTAAEEWGLLGARYFVKNPIHTGSEMVANVNIDMVGSVDDKYKEKEDVEYTYIIGAGLISEDLEEILQQANKSSAAMYLDQKYNHKEDFLQLYRRSDQWAFGEQHIPFVFFFSGLHDDYHRPSDTIDRIKWPLLVSRAELITEYVWRLAETPERPERDRN